MKACGLALLMAFSGLAAQDTTCSYDRCALWMRDGRLYAGMPGQRLRGRDALLLLATRSDSATYYARRHRRSDQVGSTLGAVGLFGMLAYGIHRPGRVAAGEPPRNNVEATWYFGSLGLATIGVPFMLTARRSAGRAIWWYNRDLPEAGPPRDSSCTYDRCALWVNDGRIQVGMPGRPLKHPHDLLPALLRDSPQGSTHAANYRRRILRTNTMRWASAALIGGSLMSLGLRGFDDRQIGFPGLEIVGIAAGLLTFEASIFTELSATKEAQRAAWWYNRDLPRPLALTQRATASSSR